MSKGILNCLAVAFVFGLLPGAALAEDAQPSPKSYVGPLPAGGAMTDKAAALWYHNGVVYVGGGVVVGGLLLLIFSKNGHSSTATTSTATP